MKRPVLVGWVELDKLMRCRASMQRPMAEAENTTIYAKPATQLVPLHALLEIEMPEEPKYVPQTVLLYESDTHPGLFVDNSGRYFRIYHISMELNCPYCGFKHVDKPEPGWDNPPHKTHLCHGCKKEWRPAAINTFGVERIRS